MFHKRIFMMLSLLLCCLWGVAQDVIVCKDGTSLLGKVIEITDSEVKYRKADNPDGPLYAVKVASVTRINYENGTTDVFTPDGIAPATVLAGTTGDVKDTDLLKIHRETNKNYAEPRKFKLIGYIGGGILLATGVTLAAIGWSNAGGFYPGNEPGLIIPGIALTAAGAVWMPTFYLIGRYKEKKLNELAIAPLYRQEVFSVSGKSLSMGVDIMADKMQTRSLGLGMTFKF